MPSPYKMSIFILLITLSLDTFSQPNENRLSDAEKLYGLSKVWSEAKYNFVYFDKLKLDWDSLYQASIPRVLQAKDTRSYYDVLRQFIAHLMDGHTSVWYPSSYYKNEFALCPFKDRYYPG